MPKKLFNLFQNEINLTTGIINSCMQSALFSHLKACKNMKESRSGFLMKRDKVYSREKTKPRRPQFQGQHGFPPDFTFVCAFLLITRVQPERRRRYAGRFLQAVPAQGLPP